MKFVGILTMIVLLLPLLTILPQTDVIFDREAFAIHKIPPMQNGFVEFSSSTTYDPDTITSPTTMKAKVNLNQEYSYLDELKIEDVRQMRAALIDDIIHEVNNIDVSDVPQKRKIVAELQKTKENMLKGSHYAAYVSLHDVFKQVEDLKSKHPKLVSQLNGTVKSLKDYNKPTKSASFLVSPKKQLENDILPKEILCKPSFKLVLKVGGDTACVKAKSVHKLFERGWAIAIIR